MADQIQLRRDTEANWEFRNPILAQGEIAITLDNLEVTPKFKIGDGIHAWQQLPYFFTDGGDKHFMFSQPIMSNQWHIVHGLDKRPAVSITDEYYHTIWGEVHYITNMALVIYFNRPVRGYAFLN